MLIRRGLIWIIAMLVAARSSAEPVFSSPNVDANVSPGGNVALDMTPDGRFILFSADADDMVADDTNQLRDLIIRDRIANTTELISVGASLGNVPPSEINYLGAMSADGRFVVFVSRAAGLVPGVNPAFDQIFVRDRVLKQTQLVSKDDSGMPLEADSIGPAISDDGRYVAFSSSATSISGGQDPPRIYLVDLVTGERRVVSRNRGGSAPSTTGTPGYLSMSGDGRWVTFAALALLPGLPPEVTQIYRYDRNDDSIEVISRTPTGELGDGYSDRPHISRDGHFVAFFSSAPNLTGRPANEWHFLRQDRSSGALAPIDINEQGVQMPMDYGGVPIFAYVSSTGRFISYSVPKRLIPGVPPSEPFGTYVRDMQGIRSVIANVDRQGGRRPGVGPVTDDGRFMVTTGGGAMYPPGMNVPAPKMTNTIGDVFLQDISSLDLAVTLTQVGETAPWIVDLNLDNRSALQATLMEVRLTSSAPLVLGYTDPENACGGKNLAFPIVCYIPVAPAGRLTTIRLFISPGSITSADLNVVVDVNEPDNNLTNNSAHVTVRTVAPPPPPAGGAGHGGGGAIRWQDLAVLAAAWLMIGLRAGHDRYRHRHGGGRTQTLRRPKDSERSESVSQGAWLAGRHVGTAHSG